MSSAAEYLSTYGPKPITLVAHRDEAHTLPLPDGTPATLQLLPLDSGRGRIAVARFSATPDDPIAQYDALLTLLAAVTVGWTLPFEHTEATARLVYSEIGWLADDAWKALQAQEAFTVASATPSSRTSDTTPA